MSHPKLPTKLAVRAIAAASKRFLLVIVGFGLIGAGPFSAWAAPKPPSAKASGASSEKTAPIDVNTASVDALVDLPGIGRSTAQRIVDYRKEHGPFKSLDELLNVRGIGEKSLARLRDKITVGPGGGGKN